MRIADLTKRQRQVAELICRGDTNREIADALGISIKTVDSHRGAALERLGAKNNVDLLLMAIREGFVVPDLHESIERAS